MESASCELRGSASCSLNCAASPHNSQVRPRPLQLEHDAMHHRDGQQALTEEELPHWDSISDEDAARVRALQDAIRAAPAVVDEAPFTPKVFCTWCGCTTHSTDIESHMRRSAAAYLQMRLKSADPDMCSCAGMPATRLASLRPK